MNEERIREIVRQFPENGMKAVLTSAANVRELLALAEAKVLPRLDFARMQVDPTTYVTAEYRHLTSDLVLTVTLLPGPKVKGKGKKGKRRRKRLTVTILIELQSQPDRLMVLRVLEYLVQVWKQQVKEYGAEHGSLASVQLRPVLPVVLHTGSYPWKALGTLLDLMEDAADFADVTPLFRPLFVSLPDTTEEALAEVGPFGQVLALTRARKASRANFADVLGRTVERVSALKGEERLRRTELLSYVEAFVYHSRGATEHDVLRGQIDDALRADEARLEVEMVRRTMADVHADQARLVEKKETLLDQLRLRYAPLPAEIETVVQSSQDANQLTTWLRNFATAEGLDDVGILAPR